MCLRWNVPERHIHASPESWVSNWEQQTQNQRQLRFFFLPGNKLLLSNELR